MTEDVQAKMSRPGRVVDPETGHTLFLDILDERYQRIVDSYRDSECQHPSVTPMRIPIRGGKIQVGNCCTECGVRIGGSLSQKDKPWVQSLPERDSKHTVEYENDRVRKFNHDLLELAKVQRSERGKFSKDYHDYINSQQWKNKRKLVFERCGGVCEGCGTQPAEQVHHLSYKNFGEDFLFELVGLCESCHERVHTDDEGQSSEADS